jgi:hypothetical protein
VIAEDVSSFVHWSGNPYISKLVCVQQEKKKDAYGECSTNGIKANMDFVNKIGRIAHAHERRSIVYFILGENVKIAKKITGKERTCQPYNSASLFKLSHNFLSFVAMKRQYRFVSVLSIADISRNQSSVELDDDWKPHKANARYRKPRSAPHFCENSVSAPSGPSISSSTSSWSIHLP